MGYTVRLQKVVRPNARSYYINLPVVLAETLGFVKGETLEWSVENQTTLLLRRISNEKDSNKNLEIKKVRNRK
jgi:antitoxin component of MazEF toxin-antitoxin module